MARQWIGCKILREGGWGTRSLDERLDVLTEQVEAITGKPVVISITHLRTDTLSAGGVINEYQPVLKVETSAQAEYLSVKTGSSKKYYASGAFSSIDDATGNRVWTVKSSVNPSEITNHKVTVSISASATGSSFGSEKNIIVTINGA